MINRIGQAQNKTGMCLGLSYVEIEELRKMPHEALAQILCDLNGSTNNLWRKAIELKEDQESFQEATIQSKTYQVLVRLLEMSTRLFIGGGQGSDFDSFFELEIEDLKNVTQEQLARILIEFDGYLKDLWLNAESKKENAKIFEQMFVKSSIYSIVASTLGLLTTMAIGEMNE